MRINLPIIVVLIIILLYIIWLFSIPKYASGLTKVDFSKDTIEVYKTEDIGNTNIKNYHTNYIVFDKDLMPFNPAWNPLNKLDSIKEKKFALIIDADYQSIIDSIQKCINYSNNILSTLNCGYNIKIDTVLIRDIQKINTAIIKNRKILPAELLLYIQIPNTKKIKPNNYLIYSPDIFFHDPDNENAPSKNEIDRGTSLKNIFGHQFIFIHDNINFINPLRLVHEFLHKVHPFWNYDHVKNCEELSDCKDKNSFVDKCSFKNIMTGSGVASCNFYIYANDLSLISQATRIQSNYKYVWPRKALTTQCPCVEKGQDINRIFFNWEYENAVIEFANNQIDSIKLYEDLLKIASNEVFDENNYTKAKCIEASYYGLDNPDYYAKNMRISDQNIIETNAKFILLYLLSKKNVLESTSLSKIKLDSLLYNRIKSKNFNNSPIEVKRRIVKLYIDSATIFLDDKEKKMKFEKGRVMIDNKRFIYNINGKLILVQPNGRNEELEYDFENTESIKITKKFYSQTNQCNFRRFIINLQVKSNKIKIDSIKFNNKPYETLSSYRVEKNFKPRIITYSYYENRNPIIQTKSKIIRFARCSNTTDVLLD